jgi:predicted transcriptional regulator
MKRVEILLDDETGRILDSLAEFYEGDRDEAIRELLRTLSVDQAWLDEMEEQNADSLIRQKARAERDIAAGRLVTLDEVRRRAGL